MVRKNVMRIAMKSIEENKDFLIKLAKEHKYLKK